MSLAQGHRASGLEILEQRGETGDFSQQGMQQGFWVGAVGDQERENWGHSNTVLALVWTLVPWAFAIPSQVCSWRLEAASLHPEPTVPSIPTDPASRPSRSGSSPPLTDGDA